MKRSISSIPMTPDFRGSKLVGVSSSRTQKRSSGIRLSGVSAWRASLISTLSGRPSYQESRGAESKQQSGRSAFTKNLKLIVSFLAENKYPYPLNKLNSSPSAKDVTSIFEFIVSMIAPELILSQKFEDGFPLVMKMLRYPHNVTKRQLQPVGSMHNWPTIVAGFAWLINLVKINKETYISCGITTGNIEQPLKSDILMQFHINPFKDYVMGGDDHDQLDAEFEDNLPSILGLENYKHVQEMTIELENLQKVLAEIDDQKKDMLGKLGNIKMDTEKINMYLEELVPYVKRIDEAKAVLSDECHKLSQGIHEFIINEEEHATLVKEINCKGAVVATQKVTVEEVRQLQSTLAGQEGEFSRIANVLSQLNEEIVAEEADISKLRTEVSTIMEQYCRLAAGCQLIPATADNAQDFDYELKLSDVDSEDCPHVGEVESRLDIILKQFKSKAREMRSGEMELINVVNKFNGMVSSLNGDIADAETNIRCKEETLALSKEEKAQELQMMQAEIDLGEKEIAEIQSKMTMSLNLEKTHAEAQELKKCIEDLERVINEKRNDSDIFLQSEFEKAKQHVRNVQAKAAMFSGFAVRMKERFLSLKLMSEQNSQMLQTKLDEHSEVLNNIWQGVSTL